MSIQGSGWVYKVQDWVYKVQDEYTRFMMSIQGLGWVYAMFIFHISEKKIAFLQVQDGIFNF